jgi:uncharacterized membrane protein
MNFPSFKNSSPLFLYLLSVVSFVLANVIRDKKNFLYTVLLVLGAGFFIFGLMKRMKSK